MTRTLLQRDVRDERELIGHVSVRFEEFMGEVGTFLRPLQPSWLSVINRFD